MIGARRDVVATVTARDPRTGYSIELTENLDGSVHYALHGFVHEHVVTSRAELAARWGTDPEPATVKSTMELAFELLRRYINQFTVPCDAEECTLP